MSDDFKYDVFISYARKDGLAYAERLAEHLNESGYTVWFKRIVNPNQDMIAEFEQALENSQLIIVILTSTTRHQDIFFKHEIDHAIAVNKPIISLIFEGIMPLPHLLNPKLKDINHSQLQDGVLRDKISRFYIEHRYKFEVEKYRKRGEEPPFTLEQVYKVLGNAAMADVCAKEPNNQPPIHYFQWYANPIPQSNLSNFIDFAMSLHVLVEGEVIEHYRNKTEQTYRFIYVFLRDHFAYEYSVSQFIGRRLNGTYFHPAKALGIYKDKRAVEPLLATLQNPNVHNRDGIATALGEIGDVRALEPLLAILQDENEDHDLRGAVARALGAIGDKRALGLLLTTWQNENERIRSEEIDPKEVKTHLWVRFRSAELRIACLEGLAQLDPLHTIELLLTSLQDNQDYAHKCVAQAMTDVNNQMNEFGLTAYKYQARKWLGKVNQSVKEALQKIGTPEALQALKDAEEKGSIDY